MSRRPLKSDPSDVRANNIRAAFSLVSREGKMTRAELGRRMGLSRMAVSDVVSQMVGNRLLRKVGLDRRTGRGKRSVMLAVDTDGWLVASVDLTQRYVLRAVLTDLLGHIVERVEIPYECSGSLRFETVDALCAKVLGQADRPVLGLGVAVPGVVNPEGTVIRSVALGWSDVALRAHLEQAHHLPVLVCNDVNMGLLGECTFGEGSADSLFVRIGQGVGAAVCVSGKIVDGSGYSAGEIGHVVVDPQGPECVCGKHGCLETMVSVPRLRERLAAQTQTRETVLRQAGTMLGAALAMSIGLLDLADISVAGPADIVGTAFLDGMRDELKAKTFVDYHCQPAVHRCEQGDDLVLRGQAVAVVCRLVDSVRDRDGNDDNHRGNAAADTLEGTLGESERPHDSTDAVQPTKLMTKMEVAGSR
ncbi:ROK family transcriptional regulator [Bifidobacterium sp. ESL0704]|uniref:ROK family transcriptional regulator n=1 Tax=Bifidobacterium sp. ESL0704 TaxID=2983219 RepID=UPI0023F78DDB|nr:ROK family transcriptional regulator [Bifidobacterium sp. ESL0704]WEV53467.1 ROK family transcriptional regulator [Bifidobacterium sp. ESL0704]